MLLDDLVIFKNLGIEDYLITWPAMQQFTKDRDPKTVDQIWFLQHNPVFTLGKTASEEHLLEKPTIAVVRTDRGGQITYHAPGQLIIYFLLDLKRRSLELKKFILKLQQIILMFLADLNIFGNLNQGAPGVYILGKKVCSLGLKIIKGCCYHGLSLNIAMDLQPFTIINPCGTKGLMITQLSEHGFNDLNLAIELLRPIILKNLNYVSID